MHLPFMVLKSVAAVLCAPALVSLKPLQRADTGLSRRFPLTVATKL